MRETEASSGRISPAVLPNSPHDAEALATAQFTFRRRVYGALFSWPRLRSWWVRLKIRCCFPGHVGDGVKFGKYFMIDLSGGFLVVGSDTAFADRCRLAISGSPIGRLTIGERCYFASGVLIGAGRDVTIGNDVLVGEYTSIRDTSHRFESVGRPINTQGEIFGAVTIGNDVWIGRGCLILGSERSLAIGDGAVIGANSIVRTDIPAYAIAVGSPARVVGSRR